MGHPPSYTQAQFGSGATRGASRTASRLGPLRFGGPV